jgi:acyl-CoA thioester hydrolase
VKIRVYYEDTDCGNVVYYANYLRYMERGRTEYLRERGIELETYHRQGVLFAVAEVNVKYRRPARYNDLIDMETTIIDTSSITFIFETTFYNRQGELLAAGAAKMVCIDAETGRACKIPKDLVEKIRLR